MFQTCGGAPFGQASVSVVRSSLVRSSLVRSSLVRSSVEMTDD
jgi:hypothetical protein